MPNFWKKLMGRRAENASERAEDAALDSPAERRVAAEGVEGLAADEVAEEHLGGFDPGHLADDDSAP